MKERNLIKTQYYDYHMLKISLETSKITLDSYKLELDELNQKFPKNLEKIKEIQLKIEKRKSVITRQENLLKEMENLIKSFPNHLKRIENLVFEYSIIENYNSEEIAETLGYAPEYIRRILSRIKNKWIDYQKLISQ